MQIYEGSAKEEKEKERQKEEEGCADRRALRRRPASPNRRRITCTRESCYANTRQHSEALTAWRAENESPIFAEDREKDGGRLYWSRRDDACLVNDDVEIKEELFFGVHL